MGKEQKLTFSNKGLKSLITQLANNNTIIVVDGYNYPQLSSLKNVILVDESEIEHINQVKRTHKYSKVIAVGGCSSLDFGRACAVKNGVKTLTAVPTIISTVCLGIDVSVIKKNGKGELVKTTSPHHTIISMPTLEKNHSGIGHRWTASGLGDLAAIVSASIEYEYKNNDNSFTGIVSQNVITNIPEVFVILDKMLSHPNKNLDAQALKDFAYDLHKISVNSIKTGKNAIITGSEHKLYHQMQQDHNYNRKQTTHGVLTAIGTLISARIFAEATQDFSIYDVLQTLYKKYDLPLTNNELTKINVSQEHIISSIKSLPNKNNLYNNYFADNNFDILERIFPCQQDTNNVFHLEKAQVYQTQNNYRIEALQ